MTYWRLFYHFAWGTKNRVETINEQRFEIARGTFAAVCTSHDVLIHAIGWMPDHIHLAVSIPPKVAIADVAQQLKGTSSFRINEAGGDTFAWQPGYGVVSFNERLLPTVIEYIEHQREHHARKSLIPALERLHIPETPKPSGRQIP